MRDPLVISPHGDIPGSAADRAVLDETADRGGVDIQLHSGEAMGTGHVKDVLESHGYYLLFHAHLRKRS